MSMDMKIRFYDNDPEAFRGIQTFSLPIQPMRIRDEDPNVLVQHQYKTFRQKYPDRPLQRDTEITEYQELNRAYYQNYKRQLQKERAGLIDQLFQQLTTDTNPEPFRVQYLPSNGLTDEQIVELMEWALRNFEKPRVVFFDWDRTLTVMEGLYPIFGHPRLGRSMERNLEYLYYLFGGKERFEKIKALFRFLREANVKVYILTNNDIAANYPHVFIIMMRMLDPEFPPRHIFPSGRTPPTQSYSNKLAHLDAIRKGTRWDQVSSSRLSQTQKQRLAAMIQKQKQTHSSR